MMLEKSRHHIKVSPRSTGVTILVVVLLLGFFLWGFVLPRIAEWESVRNRAERFSKAGINPAAIYYSDHPGMNEIEGRVERKLNR
jgi:hypothetical protein